MHQGQCEDERLGKAPIRDDQRLRLSVRRALHNLGLDRIRAHESKYQNRPIRLCMQRSILAIKHSRVQVIPFCSSLLVELPILDTSSQRIQSVAHTCKSQGSLVGIGVAEYGELTS